MLKYNKKNQPYEIISRFRILESEGVVEYCRIKFFNTGHEASFKTGLVKELNFEDMSIVEASDVSGGVIMTDTITSNIEPITAKSVIQMINESPAHITDGATSINLTGVVHAKPSETVVQDDITSITSFSDLVDIANANANSEYTPDDSPSNTGEYVVITATSPEGKEIEIQDAIGEFCAHYKLDMDAVELCIAGKQKTHKKWKFKTV